MSYLTMVRGDDRVLEVTASEDLVGSELTFTARHRRHSPDIVIEKTTAAGIVLGDPTTTAEITIDAADTEDLDPDVLYWDIEVVDGTDKVHTIASGRLAVLEDVTRPA